PAVLRNVSNSLRPNGRFIVVEPLHESALLARKCRLGAAQFARLAQGAGLSLLHKSGLQLWPARMFLSRAFMARWPTMTQWGYRFGEVLLRIGPAALSDYKVLVFEK